MHNKSKDRRAETNKASSKIQLILPYSLKQGKELILQMKKYIRKTLPENVQAIVTYQSENSTGTPSRIHVDSTGILRRYVEDQISTNFHVISSYFFDVILMVRKSTSFPRTFFDVISLIQKSTLFPRTFFDVISLIEKSTLFPRTFFDVICLVEICTLFLLTSFDVILLGKNSTSFLVSC